MSIRKHIYLAKSGRVKGPITSTEFQAIKDSGKLNRFSWIWDGQNEAWKPIDPPPPPLTDLEYFDASSSNENLQGIPNDSSIPRPRSGLNLKSVKTISQSRVKGVQAICHDFKEVVSGTLNSVSNMGCEFVSDSDSHSHSPSPKFSKRCQVQLNLLDSKSGKSVSVNGKMIGAVHSENGWTYQINWMELPVLFQN